MAIRLNHTIVAARDKQKAALFLTEILGLPAAGQAGVFAWGGGGDPWLVYRAAEGELVSQHYAFLVDESKFEVFSAHIGAGHLVYWAAPYRHKRDEINAWDGGRGIYFDD